jgi:hypothetical protein
MKDKNIQDMFLSSGVFLNFVHHSNHENSKVGKMCGKIKPKGSDKKLVCC